MKHILKYIISILLVSNLVIACNTTTSNNPNEVLQSFFEDLSKRDIDGASKYVTANSRTTMQLMKKGLAEAERAKDSIPQKDFLKEFEGLSFSPAKITGNAAIITVSSKNHEIPDADFKLIKENSGWKVDFTMETLLRMGMESAKKSGHEKDVQHDMQAIDSAVKNMDPKMLDELSEKLKEIK